ncbi:hypothetical protein SLA2020_330950 [Shorea laevis]
MDSSLILALTFIAKIRFTVTDELYRTFLRGFGNLRKGIWGLDELEREVNLLFKDHPDLIEEFRSFQMDCQSISGVCDDEVKQLWIPQSHNFEQYLNLLKPFYIFGNGIEKRVENSLRNYSNGFAKNPLSKSESKSEKPKKKRKGSPEVESKSEKSRKKKRCTPSYEFLPDYDPKAAEVEADCDSQMVVATPLEPKDSDLRKVLNSSLVCVQQAEYATRPPRLQTPQEKMMNEIEDDLFQLDMTLAWFGSAAENIEECFKENKVEGTDIREHLTAMNLRCIENLYKNHPDILKYLYENPVVGLPVLSRQLRRKEGELKEKKEEKMKKIHGLLEEKKEELKQLHFRHILPGLLSCS